MSIYNRSFYVLVNLPVSNGAGKAQAGLGPGRPHKVGEVGGGCPPDPGAGGLRETVSLVLGRFPQFSHAHVDGDVNQSEGEGEREGEG